ncbi:MAG: hypothetical protein IMW91_05600 [Firmicutes bacterium]|nr:hypothetical protein [Bacillota bacterium]
MKEAIRFHYSWLSLVSFAPALVCAAATVEALQARWRALVRGPVSYSAILPFGPYSFHTPAVVLLALTLLLTVAGWGFLRRFWGGWAVQHSLPLRTALLEGLHLAAEGGSVLILTTVTVILLLARSPKLAIFSAVLLIILAVPGLWTSAVLGPSLRSWLQAYHHPRKWLRFCAVWTAIRLAQGALWTVMGWTVLPLLGWVLLWLTDSLCAPLFYHLVWTGTVPLERAPRPSPSTSP